MKLNRLDRLIYQDVSQKLRQHAMNHPEISQDDIIVSLEIITRESDNAVEHVLEIKTLDKQVEMLLAA